MELPLLRLSALIALIPAALIVFRRTPRRDLVFWASLGVALAGTLAWVYVRQSAGWSTGISTALWLTIAASLLIFCFISALSKQAWRWTPLLLPYLLLLAILATAWGQAPEQPLSGGAPLAWIGTHIAVSVATYALITLAAVGSLAAALQQRAIKSKKRPMISRLLPSVADSEVLVVRLLLSSAIVLAVGLATGMAIQYLETGALMTLDHKTVLSLAVFLVLIVLLLLHFRTGMRGRAITRVVLLAYLLLTLGYPGVKFVTDILLA
ncbi:MAG: cytochrome c biogenesis protein CcsA [Rhodospirillales bacterium]|nr:cytochrome c biogenesis protein CcsA [Rhodospirillales bacterium]